MTTPKTPDKLSVILKSFDEKIKPMFAEEATICKKCGHLADSHYWNGGGDYSHAGYDTCRVDGCGCVDYDVDKDFETVVTGYSEGQLTIIKDFITTVYNQGLAEGREEAINFVEEFMDEIVKQ